MQKPASDEVSASVLSQRAQPTVLRAHAQVPGTRTHITLGVNPRGKAQNMKMQGEIECPAAKVT